MSGRSLTALEGLGPSTQKTKTERRRRDFVAKTLQNVRVSMHSGHPSNSATIPSLHRPTRPTRPVDHPTGRPAHHLPPLGPTLGTRPDGPLSPGPLPPPLCFLFSWLARSLSRPGPVTDREIENTPPGGCGAEQQRDSRAAPPRKSRESERQHKISFCCAPPVRAATFTIIAQTSATVGVWQCSLLCSAQGSAR